MKETNRAQINKDRTVEDIKAAFISLYEEYDIHAITVKAICDTARISRTMFYRYFEDKYAILEEVESYLIEKDEIFQTLSETKNLDAYLLTLFSWAANHRFYLKSLLIQKDSSRMFSHWNRNIEKGILPLLNINENNIEYLDIKLRFAATGYSELFLNWLSKTPYLPPEEIAKVASELIRNTIK